MKQIIDKRTGRTLCVPSIERLAELAKDDDGGFCINCGEEAHGVEPDASKYRCEHCGQNMVYGAEQMVLLGHFY